MANFQALLLEGPFYEEGGVLKVVSDKGARSVDEALASFEGQRIRFAAHHLPPYPPDPTAWGGGCCLWQPSGHCPAGHHLHPGHLYTVSLEGTLRHQEGRWSLVGFDGSSHALALAEQLPGHQGRIAAASLLTVEGMREAVFGSGDTTAVEGLVNQAMDLSEVLERLRAFTEESG